MWKSEELHNKHKNYYENDSSRDILFYFTEKS